VNYEKKQKVVLFIKHRVFYLVDIHCVPTKHPRHFRL